jgi:hypothetical protein
MFKSSQNATLAERYDGTSLALNPNVSTLSDVGGWLWLLIANLGFSAIRNLVDVMTGQEALYARGIALISVVTAGAGVFFLVKKDKRGVSLAKYTFGLYIGIFGLALIGSNAQGPDTALFMKGLLSSIVWLTYLFVSKRVKAVYFPAVAE